MYVTSSMKHAFNRRQWTPTKTKDVQPLEEKGAFGTHQKLLAKGNDHLGREARAREQYVSNF